MQLVFAGKWASKFWTCSSIGLRWVLRQRLSLEKQVRACVLCGWLIPQRQKEEPEANIQFFLPDLPTDEGRHRESQWFATNWAPSMWKDISGKEKKPSLSQASINAKDYSIESHHTMNVCKVGGSFFNSICLHLLCLIYHSLINLQPNYYN